MVARIASIVSYIGPQKNDSGIAIEPDLDELSMGALVAEEALSKASLEPSAVTTLIFASAGIRQIFPSCAAGIAEQLGLNCKSFDVLAGCAGFGQAIELASRMGGNVLVVTADTLSRTVEPNDPSHRALKQFADGAAAVLVSHDGLPGHRIIDAIGESEPFCYSYYGAKEGKLQRSLPAELKPRLRGAYLESWSTITKKLIQHVPRESKPWVYCNQGDKQLLPSLRASIEADVQQVIETGHGHAGGADPWIGLMEHPPAKGQFAIMLSSGIGFHFHGILVEMGQCTV